MPPGSSAGVTLCRLSIASCPRPCIKYNRIFSQDGLGLGTGIGDRILTGSKCERGLGQRARNYNEFFPHLPVLWSGFGDKEELRDRRTQTQKPGLHPDPFPVKLRFQISESNPCVLTVPQLFPRAQEFPWVFLAGTQRLHFSAKALEANLTRTELKFRPHPVIRGLILVFLEVCSCCEGVGDGIIKKLIL